MLTRQEEEIKLGEYAIDSVVAFNLGSKIINEFNHRAKLLNKVYDECSRLEGKVTGIIG